MRDCADPLMDDIIVPSGTEDMSEDKLIRAHEKDLRRVLDVLDCHQMVCKPTKAFRCVKEVTFAGHVVGHGQPRLMPGKLATLNHWQRSTTISELRSSWASASIIRVKYECMPNSRDHCTPGYYAVLNRYCKVCAVCRATKHQNQSTARISVHKAIPESPMRSISIDVFEMPEVSVKDEVFEFVILAVDRHSRDIVVLRNKSKRKDKRDKHRVVLQAKTVAQAMIRYCLTTFYVPAVICSDTGTPFVRAWFCTMCKYMGVKHSKTVAYHSNSNARVEVAGRQLFHKFRQLHIGEPGRKWYHSLLKVLQAYHKLPRTSGLSPHR